MNIIDNIRKLRLKRNYSQQGLADLLGKSRSWMCKMESGDIDPKLSVLEEIADKCKIALRDLLTDRFQLPEQLNTPEEVNTSGNVHIPKNGNLVNSPQNTNGAIYSIVRAGRVLNGDIGPGINKNISVPQVAAIDGAGNMYFSDPLNYRIWKLNISGIISSYAGTGIAGFSGDGGLAIHAQIEGSSGVAADEAGNVFFADAVNRRIRKIDPAGVISTFAGTGVSGYSGDGAAAINAELSDLSEIAVDKMGNVYFRDGKRIRKINLAGDISTPVLCGTLI